MTPEFIAYLKNTQQIPPKKKSKQTVDDPHTHNLQKH